MGRAPEKLSDLPLFCDDARLGTAVLGTGRACEWENLARLLEAEGLPKIDPLMGGRYVPAVKAFFDNQNGLRDHKPKAPDGRENLEAWNTPKRRIPA